MSHPSTTPKILVLGAGSRGHAYAAAISAHTAGRVVGIAEPVPWKRDNFVKRYGIDAEHGLVFDGWREAVDSGRLQAEVDGVCVCTLDETHTEIVAALRPLNLHILCEKPLATTLSDVRALHATVTHGGSAPIIFAVGHVLRYSAHNRLLHKLVVADAAVGDVVNVQHTEPVGNWHFAHSYVRGNWKRESESAPSLLTKCCHDIDLLLWLLTSPTGHTPARVSSHGALVGFRRSQKPALAGAATNCLACPAEKECAYSAKRIYIDHCLHRDGNTGWPNKIVAPDIEDAATVADATSALLAELVKPHGYGRCVYEAANDVVDNQTVTLEWDDDPATGRGAKIATLTMIAHTQRICERQTKVYGTRGELTADSQKISVYDFGTQTTRVYKPETMVVGESGHGGGDTGLARAWIEGVQAVMGGEAVEVAQRRVGVTVEEAVRSHEVVWWAEMARRERRVVEWGEWEGGWVGGEKAEAEAEAEAGAEVEVRQ
ncbi:hypothetical protein EDC01DRAFT_707704 [Geopyxis carbonaria]|nr:hypothetical protein EDC01DRAFT_707704 [Geopyxis carbonaria]